MQQRYDTFIPRLWGSFAMVEMLSNNYEMLSIIMKQNNIFKETYQEIVKQTNNVIFQG